MTKNILSLIKPVPLLFILLSGILGTSVQAWNEDKGKIKNVILIIGDGMGPGQIGLLEAYARQATNPTIKNRTTAFSRMLKEGGVLGVSMTNSANVLTTDSASSATQLATGKLANPETIGVDADGNSTLTILDIAKKMGKSTGLVSDVRLTHSTPASFAAHQPSRLFENDIAIDMLATGPDVMLSGGLRHWIPKQANDKTSAVYKQLIEITDGSIKIKSRREDERNLVTDAQHQGYQLAFTKQQLANISGENTGKVLGLFSDSILPNGIIANQQNKNSTIPTLTEMSAKAIELLEKNEQGFFLMIESGLIDWAAHDNDTGTLLHEMLKMNDTLNYVLDWAKYRDDTLIIVTADHETGGFGLSYSGSYIPSARKLKGAIFKNTKYQPKYNYGAPEILDKLYNQTLSYPHIFQVFDSFSPDQQTALQLMKIVNNNTDFDITEDQAVRILETEDNPFYIEGHYSLYSKRVPKVSTNHAFFVYQLDNRRNLLAIEVAEKQSVVWSNGTHTASPVLVFAVGDKKVTNDFVQFMGHPELGQKIINVLTGTVN